MMLRSIVTALCLSQASGFGIVESFQLFHNTASAGGAVQAAHHAAPSLATDLLGKYTSLLAEHPLPTKMMTGATLAVAGDAIAQSREPSKYDTRRASSFAAFDMAYRALQHNSFPIIVENCHGQFLSAALASIPLVHADKLFDPNYVAAMEQTLASQLGIVPFLYYPAFFAISGAVQGLSAEGSVKRAVENFVPLMQRNLLFWIPVQFVQFGWVPEDLQIPFLSVCGLAWTFILSVAAGSTKNYAPQAETAQLDEQIVANPTNVVEVEDIEKEVGTKKFPARVARVKV